MYHRLTLRLKELWRLHRNLDLHLLLTSASVASLRPALTVLGKSGLPKLEAGLLLSHVDNLGNFCALTVLTIPEVALITIS